MVGEGNFSTRILGCATRAWKSENLYKKKKHAEAWIAKCPPACEEQLALCAIKHCKPPPLVVLQEPYRTSTRTCKQYQYLPAGMSLRPTA